MRFWRWLGVVAIIGLGYEVYIHAGLSYSSVKPKNSRIVFAATNSPRESTAIVTRVVDGDTIVIDTGEKVRYIGMNTPESVDPRRPVQCFGKEASEYNKQLVTGKKVRLVKDVSETDKYGRLLRYVYLEDGTFVNEKLVRDGYASVMTIPPDVQLSNIINAAEREARADRRGFWAACK